MASSAPSEAVFPSPPSGAIHARVATASLLPAHARSQAHLALYFGVLMLALGLGDPRGIIHLPILYILKDALGLRPPAVAVFEAVALLPVMGGLFFGFARDRLHAMRVSERSMLVACAPFAVGGYLWLAVRPLDYTGLLGAVLLITLAFQLMDATAQGLISRVAQRHRMTGRLSALSELVEVAPEMLALLVGGFLASRVSPSLAFVLAAFISLAIVLQALWRPRAVYARHSDPQEAGESSLDALRRLLGHKPLWPALSVLALWNFAPGWNTPLLYYLSDHVGVSREAFALCKTVNLACVAATAIAYGALCHRLPLRRWLVWGVLVNILPGVAILFIDDTFAAVLVSAAVGLACGLGNVAVFDLLLRVCPKGLEGSAMMLGFASLAAADAVADLTGAFVYEGGGFVLCLGIDALATLAILPLLKRLPTAVLDAHDSHRAQTARALGTPAKP